MLDREFFLGFVKIHILYHASIGPISGVEIAEELERHGYRLGPGTLYPTLRRAGSGRIPGTEFKSNRRKGKEVLHHDGGGSEGTYGGKNEDQRTGE